jgi:DNA-binding response OmpR family regulator
MDGLAAVRTAGWCLSRGDRLADVVGISAALFDVRGEVFASVTAGGPASRIGKPVSIGARSFEILEAPPQAANELVAKDALIDRVRQGTIVHETSLQVHISALREAFGSDTTTARINSRRAIIRRAYGYAIDAQCS